MIKNKFFELWNPCSIKQHCPLIKHGIDMLKQYQDSKMARNVKSAGNPNFIIKNKPFNLWNQCSPKQHCPTDKQQMGMLQWYQEQGQKCEICRNLQINDQKQLLQTVESMHSNINHQKQTLQTVESMQSKNNTVQSTNMGWTSNVV